LQVGKLDFLARHATDPVVAAAILNAPAFLSGLRDNEFTFVRQKVEQHISPEVVEAKEATLKAMKDAEQGWRRAIEKIGERAGLEKRPDGAWLPSSECGTRRPMGSFRSRRKNTRIKAAAYAS
jgi:hypothetical protein